MTSKPLLDRPFNLLRWFSVLSLLSIVLISAASAFILSRFLTEHMLHRDAVVSMDFIDSIVQSENTWAYFVERDSDDSKAALESFFNHVSSLPDVVRANVYGQDRAIIWSSNRDLMGRRFGPNQELEEAFAGRLEVESGRVGTGDKAEHVAFGDQRAGMRFVEAYIPIRSHAGDKVIGVVELYKLPRALFHAIDEGNRLIWVSAIAGALFLYATLFWIVQRGNRVIREQQHKLIESETLAAMGEMASAVAHGIRNPLASIRSSAELALGDDLEGARESATDIIDQADRLDRWVKDLLLYSRSESIAPEKVAIVDLLRDTLAGFAPDMERQGVSCSLEALPASLPPVLANPAPLVQVINSLVANALEAMPTGGALTVASRYDREGEAVEVRITDSGTGIPAEIAKHVFRPFFTTKSSGLGIGLALARRIVTRYGGSLALASNEGQGTTVTMRLPAAR